MNLKSIFINFGQYILVFLSYFAFLFLIYGFSLSYLLTAGGPQFVVVPIFTFLSVLYIFGLWKWYKQGKWKLEVKKTMLTALIWLPAILLAAFILFPYFFPIESPDNQTRVVEMIQRIPSFSFVYVVLAAPVMEELLFRGFIAKFFFPKQMKLWQTLLYLAISSSLFSFMHGSANLVQFLIYFTMGTIFGLAYVTKKDLRYAIGLHVVNNLIAFLPLVLLS